MRFFDAHMIIRLMRWVWPVFLNVHDDIPSLMKGQVLHLMELHFFMEGVFEVWVGPRGGASPYKHFLSMFYSK